MRERERDGGTGRMRERERQREGQGQIKGDEDTAAGLSEASTRVHMQKHRQTD
jgi:hypothetical protein